VKLYDMIIPNKKDSFDEVYIVMEYADADLLKLLRHGVYLKMKHIEVVTWNLFDGVNYLHRKGIMHRDLKPANILVNLACTVKICDFGLARTFTEAVVPENMDHAEFDNVCDIPQGSKMKRVLTKHVVTRWYRAPELICLMDNYTESVDVWSLGCILAELFGMLEVVKKKWKDRGALFPGTSCFPLSPRGKNTSDKSRCTDQLYLIFATLGTPGEDDMKHLQPQAVKYIQSKYRPTAGNGFGEFRSVGEAGVHLLQGMLEFNPGKRLTMEKVMQCDFLKSHAGHKRADYSNVKPVILPFDNSDLNEEQLRELFVSEERDFRKKQAKLEGESTGIQRGSIKQRVVKDDVSKQNFKPDKSVLKRRKKTL